jgi:hypothetical protein
MPESNPPFQDSLPHVQRLVKVKHFRGRDIEPIVPFHSEGQAEPIGPIDEVFVLDHAAGDFTFQPIVSASKVRAGIVSFTRAAFFRGTSSGKVTIAQCAECLTQRLLVRIPRGIRQFPGILVVRARLAHKSAP